MGLGGGDGDRVIRVVERESFSLSMPDHAHIHVRKISDMPGSCSNTC